MTYNKEMLDRAVESGFRMGMIMGVVLGILLGGCLAHLIS